MFRALTFLSLTVFGGAVLANPVPSTLPKPNAGLWEMKTSVAEMGGMTMTLESCMDGTVEDLLKRPEVEESECQNMQFEHQGNRLTARGTCTIDGSRVDIVSEMTGDFQTSYSGQIRSTYTPPLHGMSQHTATVEGRWSAPKCHPGQQPGDTQIKGGVSIPGLGNIDLDQMMKNLPGMQR